MQVKFTPSANASDPLLGTLVIEVPIPRDGAAGIPTKNPQKRLLAQNSALAEHGLNYATSVWRTTDAR